MRALLKLYRRPHSKIAIATLSFQIATLLFFLFLKARVGDAFFGNFIAVMGVAAVTGSIASFRSEVLIYQVDRRVRSLTLLAPMGLSIVSTFLLGAVIWLWPGVFGFDIPAYAFLISFGYAFQQIAQFILIQLGHLRSLLCLKLIQSLFVTAICPAIALGLDGSDAAMAYGIAVTVPVSVWAVIWLWRQGLERGTNSHFELVMVKRALVLSGTVFVNTAAINIPTIISTATQPAQFAADFGFLMKVMAAPLALSSAMFGQLFLAKNIARDLSVRDEVMAVRRSMIRTGLNGVGFVGFCALGVIAGNYILAWLMPSALGQPHLIFPIVIATLAQASFNPISSIGEVARIENRLIAFYVVRMVLLYTILSMMWPVAFEWVFALLSVIIFTTLWFVADRNLARMERTSK